MADNVVADAGAGGSTFAAAELSFSGDTVIVPGSFVGILSGSAGSWTFSLLVGGSGAVAAGVQRVTLASDDPAVALLGTIDADTSGIITAVQLLDDVVYADDADWTDDTSKHALVGGVYQSSPHTVTDGDVTPFLTDVNGRLAVVVSGTLTVASHAVTNAGTFAVQAAQSGTWTVDLGATDNAVLDAIAASVAGTLTVGLPTGASTAAKQPALGTAGTASTDVITVQGIASMTPLLATLSGTNNIATVSAVTAITNALPAGTNAIGKLSANSGVDIGDVDVTSISAGANLIGNVGIGVRTSGGTTPIKILDSDETEDEVKATAGQIYDLYLFNSTNAILYVKLYNATAANVTVGSTTPVLTIPVPANNDTDGAGVTLRWPMGLAFSTAITIATTTGLADNDTGAPGANAMTIAGSFN